MKAEYYLGIDGGGTKTAAALLDGAGRVIARALSGSASVYAAGAAVAEDSLRDVLHQVLSAARLTPGEVTAVGLALAGAGREEEKRKARDLLARIASFTRVLVTHDAEAALVGGTGRRLGVVLVAGTGAMAYGVNAQGESRRAGGWGYLLGDEGSGFWIGLEGLRAVLRAHDGRGWPTALTGALLSHLGLPNADALVRWAYSGQLPVAEIADLVPLVSQVALDGDAVAHGILRRAGEQLAAIVSAVIRRLEMEGTAVEVVLTGGILEPGGLVRENLAAALQRASPQARVIEPRRDAAAGAALLAMGIVGEKVGECKNGDRELGT